MEWKCTRGPHPLGLLLGMSLVASCRVGGNGPGVETRFKVPEGVTAPWIAVSPDGRGWAYAERRRSDAFIVFNRRRLGPYA